jgi:hypothetical protein
MLDWLIVGGGPHGVHLALNLIERGGIVAERLRIIDPHATLLARWTASTIGTGMAFLRSPVVHHLGLGPNALLDFGRQHGGQRGLFHGQYRRPALRLFNAHCAALIADYGLDRLHVRERATGLRRLEHGWQVETPAGGLEARRVLLAISASEQPRRPAWAATLQAQGAAVEHIYAPGFCRPDGADGRRTVVVGGGIGAVQTALALARARPGNVTLLVRSPLRERKFDSEPCWLGPACLTRFWAEPDYGRRRAMLREARNPGSVPPELARTLQRAVRWGLLDLVQGEVQTADRLPSGTIRLDLADRSLCADRVLLGTGFSPGRPGGAWLDAAIAAYALPTAPCGYPIVAPSLEWAPGLFVTGALAELELGPPARNIAGARHAAQRVLQC